jgi:hypothetical protein
MSSLMLAMHADLTLGDYIRLGLAVAFLCLVSGTLWTCGRGSGSTGERQLLRSLSLVAASPVVVGLGYWLWA